MSSACPLDLLSLDTSDDPLAEAATVCHTIYCASRSINQAAAHVFLQSRRIFGEAALQPIAAAGHLQAVQALRRRRCVDRARLTLSAVGGFRLKLTLQCRVM